MIQRRELITLLGGAAAWPIAVGAQQGNRVRRIGVLMGGNENDPEVKLRYSAFMQALVGLGWADGRNLRMDLRWRGRGDDINPKNLSSRHSVIAQPFGTVRDGHGNLCNYQD
jgi:putative ABC transport system substrate-binding protein